MRWALLVLAGLAPLTSGCIAAVAPLAAGAAIVRSQERGGGASDRGPAVARAADRSDVTVTLTGLTSLPAPRSAPSLAAAPVGDPSVTAFLRYALAQAQAGPKAEPRGGRSKRLSAVLASASKLRADRGECGALPPAVFIDLDPGRESFDPLQPGAADPALGPALAQLRASGLKVVWFSRLGANFLGAARAALAEAGLDPAGVDELALPRDIGERKQSLRDEAARRLCPVAILGDDRADFDELFLYLRNPHAAMGLESLIGQGWFLASPFVPSSAKLASGASR